MFIPESRVLKIRPPYSVHGLKAWQDSLLVLKKTIQHLEASGTMYLGSCGALLVKVGIERSHKPDVVRRKTSNFGRCVRNKPY